MRLKFSIPHLAYLKVLFSCNKKEERERVIGGHWKLKNEDAFIDLYKGDSFMAKDERGIIKRGKWAISKKGDSLVIKERKGLVKFEIVKISDKELQLYKPITADSMYFER
jgi:hypothetical protein